MLEKHLNVTAWTFSTFRNTCRKLMRTFTSPTRENGVLQYCVGAKEYVVIIYCVFLFCYGFCFFWGWNNDLTKYVFFLLLWNLKMCLYMILQLTFLFRFCYFWVDVLEFVFNICVCRSGILDFSAECHRIQNRRPIHKMNVHVYSISEQNLHSSHVADQCCFLMS